MSDQTFERALLDWLDDGADRTPPSAIHAVLLVVKRTPQQRDLQVPRRVANLRMYLPFAASLAIVAVLGLGGLIYVNSPGPDTGRPTANTPTAVPALTPAPRQPPHFKNWRHGGCAILVSTADQQYALLSDRIDCLITEATSWITVVVVNRQDEFPSALRYGGSVNLLRSIITTTNVWRPGQEPGR